MKTKVNFHPTVRRGATSTKVRRHALTKCEETGLARYRDRHQVLAGAKALGSGHRLYEVTTFSCPACRGWHAEKVDVPDLSPEVPAPSEGASPLTTLRRRYVLFDIENPTRGAKATPGQVADFWRILRDQAPGISIHDHVVVGASRSVFRKYRSAIQGPNVKWVVGANAPDAADRALLRAIDLRRVARSYSELVIVSGDHAFAALAREAKSLGLTVRVVTAQHPENRPMLSRDLNASVNVRTVVRIESREQRFAGVTPTTAFPRRIPRDTRTHAA